MQVRNATRDGIAHIQCIAAAAEMFTAEESEFLGERFRAGESDNGEETPADELAKGKTNSPRARRCRAPNACWPTETQTRYNEATRQRSERCGSPLHAAQPRSMVLRVSRREPSAGADTMYATAYPPRLRNRIPLWRGFP